MPKQEVFNSDAALLELAERIKFRRKNPDITKYRPHDKQKIFHCSYCKKKLYIGGNRSGKTVGGCVEGIWRATGTHPYRDDLNNLGPTRGRVVAVSFNEGVEKIIFPQYQQWCPTKYLRGGSWESAYNKATRTLHFTNGSTIEFMSYDQDLDKFAGTSRHWIHFDEEPPKDIYKECLARLIDTDGEFWITMTPVEGITWVFDDLYEPNIEKQGEYNPDVFIVEINTLENPYLNQKAIESFLLSVDDDDVHARIEGQFVRKGGRIYKNFDPTIGGTHVLSEPIENAKEYFKDWLWICSLDHGLNNPTAVLWTAIDKEGFGVVFDEHYRAEWSVKQHADFIKLKIKQHGRMPDIFIADPSITQRNAQTMIDIKMAYMKEGIAWQTGNNDVKAGIIRVKHYWNRAKYIGRRTHPLFVDKDDKESDAFPRLRVSPACVNLIKEAKSYRWKTYRDKKLQYENNPYDEPHKKDDHALDSLRYALMTQPDLFAEAVEHEGKSFRDKVESAMAELGGGSPDVSMGIPQQREVSDPYGEYGDSNWQEINKLPAGTSWEFDEHMGGIY